MEKVTIQSVMDYLTTCAEKKIPLKPVDLLDSAVSLNALLASLDDEIAELEALMALEEANLIEQDLPASRAKVLRRKAIDYKDYLKKVALKQRAIQHIQICKKRTELPEF